MGQIKNIKLHIVTDIKEDCNTKVKSSHISKSSQQNYHSRITMAVAAAPQGLDMTTGMQEEVIEAVYSKEWDSIFRNLNYKISVNFHGQNIISKRICSQVSWQGIKSLAAHATSTDATEWFFKYTDVTGRNLVGMTEDDWKNMVETSRKIEEFTVNVFALDEDMSGMSFKL